MIQSHVKISATSEEPCHPIKEKPDSSFISKSKVVVEQITVSGLVQGVGFRPKVWLIARSLGLKGTVMNNGEGVKILLQGSERSIDRFVRDLVSDPPPLARIHSIMRIPSSEGLKFGDFKIIQSVESKVTTGALPDATACEECTSETFDPYSRRYRYPFTNCTNCGPRFSIIQDIPYDRSSTTMRGFEMCEDCRREYEDPNDRRFHAQPIACQKCGPKAWLTTPDNKPFDSAVSAMIDDVDAASSLIKSGSIVAIKGVGGFQLACDALNENAVNLLRKRKHRSRKPFALMVRDLEIVRRIAVIGDEEAELMSSPQAPIVIVNTSSNGSAVADSVAPGVRTLGFMLPNTPLHHLLFKSMEGPIVLTSGNLSDEPQCIDSLEAGEKLGSIADFFLNNDRPIAQRIDDSVVRIIGNKPRVLRRARGYAPAPVLLPNGFENAPDLLAYGGELKNTFCLLKNGTAYLSQHIGDLEDALAQADFRHNLKLYSELFQHSPAVLACDLHPEYASAKLARKESIDRDIPLIEVQHHHAHIASCLAENRVGLGEPPVIGVALDGLGFGDDGTFWGGEFFIADYRSYRRAAAFKPIAMIGGEMAIKEPWRNTYAHLAASIGWEGFSRDYSDLELYRFLNTKPRKAIDKMISNSINSPLASSCGRLFDAVAAAIGIAREHAAYEGQGAVELEALMDDSTIDNMDDTTAYHFSIDTKGDTGLLYIIPDAMWRELLDDLKKSISRKVISSRFHRGLAMIIVSMIEEIAELEGESEQLPTVALSGGVWQNKVLLESVLNGLEVKSFKVLTHQIVPSNDGGLALGQAFVAAAAMI